ncbi:MAG: hypothetical protein ACRDEA_04115 [Microcystaceae cyanobacterium]
MNLERLVQLKQKLSHEKKLDSVWSFYMAHFADYQEFTDLGQPTNNSLVEAVVTQVGQQLFNEAVSDLLLIHIADYQFIHGPFMLRGRTGGVIYFEETKMGLVAVAESPPSKEVKYSRFSGQLIPPPSQPWLN